MIRRTFRFFLRFGFFILVLLVIIVGGLALLALVGPERAIDFKKLLDAGWWFTSVIRWAVIAGIIVYLPKFAARRVEKYSQELEGWVDAYDEAERMRRCKTSRHAPATATRCASATKNCCSTTVSPAACLSALN